MLCATNLRLRLSDFQGITRCGNFNARMEMSGKYGRLEGKVIPKIGRLLAELLRLSQRVSIARRRLSRKWGGCLAIGVSPAFRVTLCPALLANATNQTRAQNFDDELDDLPGMLPNATNQTQRHEPGYVASANSRRPAHIQRHASSMP
jgi:hypothetical protein